MNKVTLIFALCLFSMLVNARKSISMAGIWSFQADSLAVGEQQHWETRKLSGAVNLPGSTDEAGLGNSLPLFKAAFGNNKLEGYPVDADFGMLTRKHKYIGVAWYQKEITIPENSGNEEYRLHLERVMWRSKIWIDGKQMGEPIDYLSSSHNHEIGVLLPGKHLITMQIDNRLIYPIGTLAHSYCPHMQTQWNGVVGKIELIAVPKISIEHVIVTPSFKNRNVAVDVHLNNRLTENQKVNIHFALREKSSGKVILSVKENRVVTTGESVYKNELKVNEAVLPWDEYTPHLYELVTKVSYKRQEQQHIETIGFRDLGVADKHFTINGRKLIYRNSHEGMFFGKTGYPAMDTDYWIKVFNVYKIHGFNAVRFHSSCPPEAAFQAADELGIYLQVEFFWLDGWMGQKNLIGQADEELNRYVRQELNQALIAYGNHPSMVLVSIGNELGGDFDKMGEWIATAKKQDSRHLYAAGIAHNITVADDYVEYGGKGDIFRNEGTDWNYSHKYMHPAAHNYDVGFRREKLPEFTHETGQYIVHPLWSEIAKYDGVLEPRNLSYFKELAVNNGIDGMDSLFQRASGNINRICYKAEIEATLRTPESAGYSLLSMVDYPGQGEALIGWVDPFYENKNFLNPKDFKAYGTHTVPLLRFDKFVWEQGDHLKAKVEVANYGPKTLEQAVVRYVIKDKEGILREGRLPAKNIVQGEVTAVGDFSFLLESGSNGKQMTVSLDIEGTDYFNSWNIWVFPTNVSTSLPKDVLVTTDINNALNILNKGGKVLLLADKLGPLKNRTYAAFDPVFWSATWFQGQATEVSGCVIQNRHPSIQLFPTEDVIDWQWKDICSGSRGFILNELPKNYYPIAGPVNDYHYGNKLGSIFELKTPQGGRLLVCGYNITDNLENRPATRQLRKSLFRYIESADFNPQQLVEEDWLVKSFTDFNGPVKKEKGFESSFLYIKAGSYHTEFGSVEWSSSLDGALKEEGYDYNISCEGVWVDNKGSYWYGKKMKIEIAIDYPKLMNLKIGFYDSNQSGRKGIVRCEDLPEVKLDSHINETWVTIPVTRENCLDGKLKIEIDCTAGPNLMITKLALMP